MKLEVLKLEVGKHKVRNDKHDYSNILKILLPKNENF